MIINAAVQEILKGKPGDELVVASQYQYYNGAPVDEHGNLQLYKKVVDVVRDGNKIVVLTE